MPEGGDSSETLTTAPEPPPAAPAADAPAADAPKAPEAQPASQTLHWRGTALLSQRQLRKLRMHLEEFAQTLTSRLSSFLRVEVIVKIGEIQITLFQRLTASWTDTCHLGLFKTEPLRGISVLHVPMPLAMSLVDRMMGGPGKAPENTDAEMSEIEKALLEQLTQIVLEEWCANWASVKELKPAPLGSETSGSFLQTASPQTNMLTLGLRVVIGELEQPVTLAVPYPAIEPLIRQLTGENELTAAAAPTPAPVPSAVKWNPTLDEVRIPVVAEWHGMELSARQILHLQLGDVLPIDADRAAKVVLRMADLPKFHGRLGVVADKWAVELGQPIKH